MITIPKIIPKKDLLTGEEFIPLRRTQRFACRENQVRYNNLLAQARREIKRPVDTVLNNNRTILIRLLGEAESVSRSRDFLLGAGYDFTAFTQVGRDEMHKHFYVYEMALHMLEKNLFLIKRR